MPKTERIENAVRSIIEEVNAGRAPNQQVSADRSTLLATPLGPLDPLSIVEIMELRSLVPVPAEWRPCMSLKDGRMAIETEPQEECNGNR